MIVRVLVVLTLVCTIAACAQPARVERMVVTPSATSRAAASPLAGMLCVGSITGGETTNPLWTSEVGNAEFRQALVASLDNAGLLAQQSSDCVYKVTANLLGLAQPIAGFNLEVTANVNYSALSQGTGAPYFQRTIITPYTAEFSDAFLAVERLRLANEGAIRASIDQFITQLIEHSERSAASVPST